MAGNTGSVSAAEIQKYIGGIDFPANKDQILRHAEGKGAPQEVIDLMREFLDHEYGSAADVSRGIGQAKH